MQSRLSLNALISLLSILRELELTKTITATALVNQL